ncbi:MAG: hypothetical protein OEY52_07105 [Gammaproteobacteria bacterium]|nr:hypothetical protein [Gammaproteobacteria bacterium]
MPIPVLNLPQTLGSNPRWLPVNFTLRGIRTWAETLDTKAFPELIDQCLYQLIKFNAINYPVSARLQILAQVQSCLIELIRNEKQIIRTAINADEPGLNTLQQLDKLFAEFANGYKLVINKLASNKKLNETESLQIQEAIYYCLKFLAQRLLLAYAQYTPPEKGIWREINHIYRYAEESEQLYHIVDDPVSDSPFPVFHSADFVYKRIVLVSLTEPYRLMKDECLELYYLCSRWVGACSLFPIRELSSQGEHVVDLADDLPPRYVTRDLHWQPLTGRLIDISEIISRVEKDLDQLLKQHATTIDEYELVSLSERQKPDMMLRILNSYRGKPVRQSKRFDLSGNISFVIGINNCHFYLANKKQISPYMDELKQSTSRVHHENSQAGNFSQLYKFALEKDRTYKWHEQEMQNAVQDNINPMGLAFTYRVKRYQTGQKITVGEIITYRLTNKTSGRWVIGTIHWMKRKSISEEQIIYDIGIKNLARNAISIAARKNNANKLENTYYRSLLIPKHVSHQQLRSLLVPALCFEVNDKLLLNFGRSIMKIRLVRLLSSSNAYTQFEFEIVK